MFITECEFDNRDNFNRRRPGKIIFIVPTLSRILYFQVYVLIKLLRWWLIEIQPSTVNGDIS